MGVGKLLIKKRGGAAVFLTIAFSCMIGLSSVLFAASRSAALRSYSDATLQTAGRAVLSEYDRRLMADYGIMAFYGDEKRIEGDIAFYADASLSGNKALYYPFVSSGKKLRPFDSPVKMVNASLKGFSLMDADRFEAQVEAAAMSEWVQNATGRASQAQSVENPDENPTLRNQSILKSLPSAGLDPWYVPDIRLEDIPSLSEIKDHASTKVKVNEYIMSVFGRANDNKRDSSHFFDYEVEYIIAGKTSDRANYSSVKFRLYFLRLVLNNAAILLDQEKVATAAMLAAAISAATGGGKDDAIKASILELWVLAETDNDMKLIDAGENIAILKNPQTWAIDDIEAILDGVVVQEMVKPADPSGMGYEDYLRILLFMTDRDTRLFRMMDLIQINLKGTYNADFQMRQHYVGYRFEAEVNGDIFSYTQRY